MAIHRRPLGRGRWLAGLAALVLLVASFLPWWQLGGSEGITPISGDGLQNASFLVFLAALATLALVALPYTSEVPPAIDRTLAYAIVLGVALLGYGLRIVDLFGRGALGLPDRAPGLWLAGLGLVALARGVYEIHEQGDRR